MSYRLTCRARWMSAARAQPQPLAFKPATQRFLARVVLFKAKS